MLSLDGILDLINDSNYKEAPVIGKWKGVYWGMSLHIAGAQPAFRDLRYGNWIYPQNYFGIEYQFLFDTFLLNRHPRESESQRDWRLSQYKPYTQAPFLQVIQVVTGAIFQDSGYSLTVEDKDDNDYIWGNNFHGKNLIQYVSDAFQNIAEDPNGMFITIPKEPYYATTTPRVEPDIWFIPSRFIKWVTKDEIVFQKDELMWAVNSMGYFRFQKAEGGRYVHVDEQQGGYYAHMMLKVPAYIAGGQWNTHGYYESWLSAAKAVADDFVGAKSSEQLVNKEASHPYIVEVEADCPACDNSSGYVQVCGSCSNLTGDCTCETCSPELRKCSKCGGEGTISHNPGERIIAPADEMNNKLVQIINPDIGINKFHAENNKELFNSMMKALHLHFIEEAQSGVAKGKDMETRYQFVLRISNDLFDRLIPKLVNDILSLRNVSVQNGNAKPAPTKLNIVKPTQFELKTSYDLIEELKGAKEAKIPDYQLAALVEDYVDKQFGGNEVLKRKTNIINQLDPLALKTDADIQIVVMNNFVLPRDAQYHYQLPKLIDELIRERGTEWFLSAPFETIKDEIGKVFDTLIPPPITLRPEVIDENRV